ncbi:MAG: metal ABC transporter substrate-binding protein [Thermovenabulum sp.]|uniref:metal ABC transporter substrate-binding protein n=1 Tax=Thermovenabulum sp. TaxID=3100335 RepID=UPI003C7EC7D3
MKGKLYKNRLTQILVIIFVLILILSTAGCQSKKMSNKDKIVVYTSIYPLYDFTKKIGQDYIVVENITPTGVEPHEFEPSISKISKIYESNAFIYLGEPMDPWAEKLRGDLAQKGIAVLKVGEGLIEGNDPHIWLSPKKSMQMAKKIYDLLVKVDEKNKAVYEKNYDRLIEELKKLDDEYKKELASTRLRDFVVSHAAFGYLAKEYGLNQVSIKGLSPQEEPSLKHIKNLIDFCRERGIKYILAESLETPKEAQALAEEAGLKILTLNPIEGLTDEEEKANEDYFSLMRKNLEVLKEALK